MKKIVAFLLAVVMTFGLCACGAEKPADTDKGGDTTVVTTTTATETEGTTTTTTEGTTTGTEAPVSSETDGTTGTEAPTTEGTKAPTTTANKKPTKTEGTTTGTKKQPTAFIPDVPTSTSTTTTTKKPTTTTTTTEPIDTRPTIKILSIGHSFSVDAMKTYMPELFQAAGYNATIAYLYYPGCSLERHYHYIKENKRAYQQYNKCTDGTWKNKGTSCVTDALWDEDWDIVTFQPSPDWGAGTMTYNCEWGCGKKVNDYDHFGDIIELVQEYLISGKNKNGPNTDVKFYYHLTWAFATDCKLWSYTYSGFDQMRMYNDFLNATKQFVLPNKSIWGYIPCITSVQNARSSFMGDTFNEPSFDSSGKATDGYHLNDKGDLVAAMTWVAYFTGKDAATFKIGTKYSDEEYAAIVEAVNNAIKTPDKVTESSYKTAP